MAAVLIGGAPAAAGVIAPILAAVVAFGGASGVLTAVPAV
ncbi:hypothetical protein SAMN05443636_3080 [Halobaculum gomorrense]|uniref:Uncharacterized protein n=1 Tax=Halobaculum gomorrense TaxID=43928 RepID=A0A1M5UMY3_9EURY|nr:hypothetical protein SAMN05443636_3080 [Halobaculum gomorrense]